MGICFHLVSKNDLYPCLFILQLPLGQFSPLPTMLEWLWVFEVFHMEENQFGDNAEFRLSGIHVYHPVIFIYGYVISSYARMGMERPHCCLI